MAEYINFDKNWAKSNKTKINDTKTNEYIIKDKVEWYKCKADITIGDKDFGNTGIVVIPVADISELPTIDIVHCNDCKYFCTDDGLYCSELLRETRADWFCADGERKEDD